MNSLIIAAILLTVIQILNAQPQDEIHIVAGHSGPYHDDMYAQNLTSLEGETAIFGCRIYNGHIVSVTWYRGRDFKVLAMNETRITNDHRIRSLYNSEFNEWELEIKRVNVNDSGDYVSQLHTHPPMKLQYHLSLIRTQSPNNTSSNLSVLELMHVKIIALILTWINYFQGWTLQI